MTAHYKSCTSGSCLLYKRIKIVTYLSVKRWPMLTRERQRADQTEQGLRWGRGLNQSCNFSLIARGWLQKEAVRGSFLHVPLSSHA